MSDHEVRVRTWVRGSTDDERNGLLGFISVFVSGLIVDGITLRRTSAGRFALAFPQRTSQSGERHAVVRPVDDHARRVIEREIFRQLGQRERERTGVEDLP